MIRNRFFILLASVGLIWSCQQEPAVKFSSLDLTKYGVPMSIQAPDSVEIKTKDYGFSKDITVKAGEDYSIQILASEANTQDVSQVKASEMASVKQGIYFNRIVSEEPDGFIYESALDSTHLNYGFRYVRLQGGREFIFQTGLIGDFSLEDVETMYQAVKQ